MRDEWRIFVAKVSSQRRYDHEGERTACTEHTAPEDGGFLVRGPAEVPYGLAPESLRDAGHVVGMRRCGLQAGVRARASRG